MVLERFERLAPASVTARLALEQALPAGWVDEVFEAHQQKQCSRELLFSTMVELTTLVSLASLYDKVRHTEPDVLRALVRGSTERLLPVLAAVGGNGASLPGWRLRMLDGNHLGAALPRPKYFPVLTCCLI